MAELKGLSADPFNNATDIANYNTEFEDLQILLFILSGYEFNGHHLFDFNGTQSFASGGVTIDVNTTDATNGVESIQITQLPYLAGLTFSINSVGAVETTSGSWSDINTGGDGESVVQGIYSLAVNDGIILNLKAVNTELLTKALENIASMRAENANSRIDILNTTTNQLPQFQSDGNLTIQENQTFVYEFNATDPDGDSLSYSIEYGNDQHHFYLNSTSGALSFTTPKDYENPEDNNSDNIYELSIMVSDGQQFVPLNLQVQVSNILENTPPSFQSDGNLTVTENTTLIYEFNVTDPDGDSLSYSIEYGNDQHHFYLNSTSGALSFTTPKDYENPEDNNSDNIYELSIMVSDGQQFVPLNLQVQVSDITENDPTSPPIDDHNHTGLPVFYLTEFQAQTLTGDPFIPSGDYALEIFFDEFTFSEVRWLTNVVLSHDGNWTKYIDPISGNYSMNYHLDYSFMSHVELDNYLTLQQLNPIGFLYEQVDNNHSNPGDTITPFDFNSIGQIDLKNQDELAEIAKDYDRVFFQSFLLNSNDPNEIPHQSELIWALSIENIHESVKPNLIIDMNGTVFAGNFEGYWMDAYNVPAEVNPYWQETEYLSDSKGIEDLYNQHPEITGRVENFPHGETEDNFAQPPIVNSEKAEILQDGIFVLRAEILATGNSPIIEVGFILSESIRFEIPIRVLGSIEEYVSFSVSLNDLNPNTNYFYKAYAINQSGESFSSIKKFKTTGTQIWYGDSIDLEAGWKLSDWFGSFLPLDNDWIYHQELGWAFTNPDGSGGLWVWTQEHNWQWTRPDVWPFLYRDQTANWLYFIKSINGQPIFYDYSSSEYLMTLPTVP